MGKCHKFTLSLLMLLGLSVLITGCSSRLHTSLVSSDDDLNGKLTRLVASPLSSDEQDLQSSPSKFEGTQEAGLPDQSMVGKNPVERSPSSKLGHSNSQSDLARAEKTPGSRQSLSPLADETRSSDSRMGREMDVASLDEPVSSSIGNSRKEGNGNVLFQGKSAVEKTEDGIIEIPSSSPTTSSSEGITPLEGQDLLTEMAAASAMGGTIDNNEEVGFFASRNRMQAMSPLEGELLGKGSIGDIFFDFDAATIRSDAESTLQVNAQILKARFGDRGVVIEGHCDERGTAEYNLVLGERRAQTTKQYLVDLGVSSSSIQTISYGKENPFCHASQPDCWKMNRRGHFVLE